MTTATIRAASTTRAITTYRVRRLMPSF
jgi:hypothetical protein